MIGAYADHASRRSAMLLTVMLTATGCLMIAVAPTYQQIGIAAPLIIVLARLIQGFAAGGEVGASTTMLVEHGTDRNRGFMGSCLLSTYNGREIWRRQSRSERLRYPWWLLQHDQSGSGTGWYQNGVLADRHPESPSMAIPGNF
nr:MFS transporter [Burkholderia vietnamiensis]